MADVILDALIDSLKLLAVVAAATYIIAFIEPAFSKKVRLNGSLAPLIGAGISLLPQCGFSVVATDLYQKRHITLGCLIAVYLTTSDEALPVFLSHPEKALDILPILAIKLGVGLLFGYLIDLVYKKGRQEVSHHLSHCEDDYNIKLMHAEGAEAVKKQNYTPCDCDACKRSDCPHYHLSDEHDDKTSSHCHNCENDEHDNNDANGCLNGDFDCKNNRFDKITYGGGEFVYDKNAAEKGKNACDNDQYYDYMAPNGERGVLYEYSKRAAQKKDKRAKIKRFLIDPLAHSLEIFAYALVINIIFGIIFYYVGENAIASFLQTNKYIAPLFAVIVGIIPNCASSIVISELYIFGGLGMGAALGGLCMNAGVAFVFLFKKTSDIKRNFAVLGLMFAISVFVAYIFSLAFNFDVLRI